MHKLWESHSKLNHKERDVGEVEKDEQCIQNNERKGITLNRVRITIDFSFGSGIFVYEKSHVTAYAYRDLRKPEKNGKIFFLSL